MRAPRSLLGLSAAAVLLIGGCAPPARNGGGRGATDGSVAINIALPIEELHLPNGLHVVLHPERSASAALVYVRYHVGSKDDPQGRSGFAHLFEHLMFRGSRNTGGKGYQDWFEDVGGETNASTNLDVTDYHALVPPSALPRAIWLEADRMAYPIDTLDEAAFTHERDVVKNEWREHYEDVPLGNLTSFAHEAIYGIDHPYGTTTIGRAEELDRATLPEARAFARAFYRPNNATLVICGLFDVPATRELVSRYFATIPPGPAPQPRALAPAKLVAEKRIEVEADVEGPAVTLAWPAPPTHGDGFEELGYGLTFFANRVRTRLLSEKQIATSVVTHYEHARLGGMITVSAVLKRGASPDTAISVIEEYLTEASRLGQVYDWESFGSYKTRALVGEVSSLEGLSGRAVRILHDIEMHGAPNAVQKDLRTLQSVHPSDVGAAIDHFLNDSPRVTLVVTPKRGAPRAGRVVRR